MEMDLIATLRHKYLEDNNIRQRIAQRAYELYLLRGEIHGHHDEDWSKAEEEILTPLIRQHFQNDKNTPSPQTLAVGTKTKSTSPGKSRAAKTPATKAGKTTPAKTAASHIRKLTSAAAGTKTNKTQSSGKSAAPIPKSISKTKRTRPSPSTPPQTTL